MSSLSSFNQSYSSFDRSYGSQIEKKISHLFTLQNKNKNKNKNQNNTKSSKKSTFSRFPKAFVKEYTFRKILLHELKSQSKIPLYPIDHISQLHKHIKNAEYFHICSHLYGNENTNYFRINPNTMIKVVNITDQELQDMDREIPSFPREVEMARIAASMGIAPEVYDDTAIFVDRSNSKAYGVIYMKYVEGQNVSDLLDGTSGSGSSRSRKEGLKRKIEEMFMKLYKHGITLISPHRKDIFVNMILSRDQLYVIDFTFAQYIADYVYQRNHERLNELYPFRKDIYEAIYHKIIGL